MTNWVLFKSGLPLVPVFDMKIIYSTEPDRLVVGTWGRGMWKTDVMPVMTPDLEPTNINTNVVGTQINMDVTVANNSQMGDAGPYYIGYYMSENDIISIEDFLLGEDSIHIHNPGLFVGEDITIEVMDIPTDIPAGTYYLGSFVDNREEVDEQYEFNNRITSIEQLTLIDAPAPMNVQASDGTNGYKIDISWDALSGPITYFYKVYRNTIDDPLTATPISPDPWNTNTTYWDSTATKGIDNYYWVQASDTYYGYRSGPLSNSDAGWKYLSPPTNVEATDGQYDNRVLISWDPAEGATNYKVWRNTTNNYNTADPLSTGWTPNTTFSDWTALPLTTYFYWVKSAMNGIGDRESPNHSSSDIGYVAFTSAPAVNATDGLYHDRIEVTWNSIPGASYYQLYYNTADDPQTSSPYGGWQTETNKTITTATRGILYYYWVKAAMDQYGGMASGYGEGDSGWRSFEPPEDVQASDGTSTDYIEITWDNNMWTEYYQVYRSLNQYSWNSGSSIGLD